MGENVVVFALVFGLVPHVFLGGDPATEGWLVFQVLWTKEETNRVFGEIVVFGVLRDDDHHRTVVIVAVAEGFLTLFQLIKVVFAPVKTVDEVESVQGFKTVRIELEDVHFLGLEVSNREEMQESHWQVFVITPLEVIHAVQTGSTGALDLK